MDHKIHKLLKKPLRSQHSNMEFNFYFKEENKGLMELVSLSQDQVEFLNFEIDFIGNEPTLRFKDVKITLSSGAKLGGFDKPLTDALYFLTHEISYMSD